MKIRKLLVDRYKRCQGACNICFHDGDCKLQKLIGEHGKAKIIEAVDNYGVR